MSSQAIMAKPLLSVAIPTYNRADYLRSNLAQLGSELASVPQGLVEVLVSDNCSPDETPSVVQEAVAQGFPVRYVRNSENLGWGRNFSQCYELAQGRYVLLLGDDDLFLDGTLAPLVDRLAAKEYGVVLLKAYGYDHDFRHEYPGGGGREREFMDSNAFFIAVGPLMTLTSSCVINKSLLAGFSLDAYSHGDLATLPLVLRAASAAPVNLFIDRYVIAGKRQNSFNYDYAGVFVGELWRTIDAHVGPGLTRETARAIERRMLFSYYPFYAFDFRAARRGDVASMRRQFAARFGRSWVYWLWLAPTLSLPRPLALVWGALTTLIGRVLGGELRRGLVFAWRRISRKRPGVDAGGVRRATSGAHTPDEQGGNG
jgi:glycosyltransferase involved in cell wall biosynthesis